MRKLLYLANQNIIKKGTMPIQNWANILPPGVRVSRLTESVRVIKGLFTDGPFTFSGKHYTIMNLEAWPKPVQHPYPPIVIGGGSRRILSMAAREANIISLFVPTQNSKPQI